MQFHDRNGKWVSIFEFNPNPSLARNKHTITVLNEFHLLDPRSNCATHTFTFSIVRSLRQRNCQICRSRNILAVLRGFPMRRPLDALPRDSRNCISVAWRRVGSVDGVGRVHVVGRPGSGRCVPWGHAKERSLSRCGYHAARRRVYALSRGRPTRYRPLNREPASEKSKVCLITRPSPWLSGIMEGCRFRFN